MAEQKKLYEGVPLGAVYEACQKSLRHLKYKIKKEDRFNQTIIAKSSMSMSSSGQEITFRMSEIGQATELIVSTSSGQLVDWGEGKKIIDGILSQTDAEIDKIRAEGRVLPVAPPTYGFGQETRIANHSNSSTRPTNQPTVEKKSSGGSWVLRIIAVVGVIWLINSNEGKELINSLLASLNVETDIEKYDCDRVASLVRGESLQNGFGARFEIVTISSLQQSSKTTERIVCTGNVSLSNGTTQQMRITVEKGPSSSEVVYRVEPI